MSSTLKPHLLVEVMGLQRRRLSPKKLCMLFLSYRDFVDAFVLAFRYRCEVEHNWPCGFEFWIRAPCGILFAGPYAGFISRGCAWVPMVAAQPNATPCIRPCLFVFDKKVHIPTLLRIAGRLTRRLESYVYKHAWMEPFLEGIDENQNMEFIHFKAGLHFLERYLRHHDNRLPTVECYRFSMFDKLGDPYIEKLLVNEKPKDANTERCRIENIDVGSMITRSIWQPVNICGKVLKVNTKVMKSLTIRGGVPYRAALRMITETYSKLERLQFKYVTIEFGPRSKEYPDYMNRINSVVQAFKTAMQNHPGAVSVSAVYYGHKTRPGPSLAETCQTTLTGFTVKLKQLYPGGPPYIVCKFQSNEGNKSLNVKASLFEH